MAANLKNQDEEQLANVDEIEGPNGEIYRRNRFGEFDIIEKETEPLPNEVYRNAEDVVEVQLGDQDYGYDGEEESYAESANSDQYSSERAVYDEYEGNPNHVVSGISGYSDKSRLAKFFNKKKKSGEKKDGEDISALK